MKYTFFLYLIILPFFGTAQITSDTDMLSSIEISKKKNNKYRYKRTEFVRVFSTEDKRKKSKAINFLKIQGGFIHDNHNLSNYNGFNLANIGWSNIKERILNELSVELIKYRTKVELDENEIDWQRERESIEFSYFRSIISQGELDNGFFIGPLGSLYYRSDFSVSTFGQGNFPIEEECLCIGLGVGINYSYELTQKVYLNFSTRITLLDIGLNKDEIHNPILPERQRKNTSFGVDFLRDQFPLNLGIRIKI